MCVYCSKARRASHPSAPALLPVVGCQHPSFNRHRSFRPGHARDDHGFESHFTEYSYMWLIPLDASDLQAYNVRGIHLEYSQIIQGHHSSEHVGLKGLQQIVFDVPD